MSNYEKKRKIYTIISFLLFILFIIVVAVVVGKPMIKMASNPEEFRKWVVSHGALGWLAFVAMQFLQIVVAIIPGEPLEVAAGYAFSTIPGSLLCLIGAGLGSSFIFLLTKKLGHKFVEIIVSKEKINSIRILHDEKKRDFFIFVIFLIPGTPKDALTYLAGLTTIPLKKFIILTSIARIPSVVSSTIVGDALGLQQYKVAVVVYGITIFFSIIGIILYKKWEKRKEEKVRKIEEMDGAVENTV